MQDNKNKKDQIDNRNTEKNYQFYPPYPYMEPYIEDDEIDLYELYLVLKKRKKIIFKTVLAFLIFAILYLVKTTPLYKASSTIVPLSLSPTFSLASLATIASNFGVSISSRTSQNILEAVLNSRELREKVIEKVNLMPYFYNETALKKSFVYKIKKSIKNLFHIKTKPPTIHEIADSTFKKYIDISSDRKVGTISINTYFKDPILAYKINIAVLNITQDIINKKTFTLAKLERIYLEKQLKQAEESLKKAEKAFFDFVKKYEIMYGIIDVKDQTSFTTNEYANLKAQLLSLQAKLKAMKEFYTSNDPKVKAVESQIAFIKEKINKILKRKKENISPEIPFMLTPDLAKKYINLKRNLEIAQTIYIILRKQYEIAKIQEQKEKIAFQVIDKPYVPSYPAKPKKKLIIIVALISGLFFGVFLAFFKEWWENIKKEHENKEVKT